MSSWLTLTCVGSLIAGANLVALRCRIRRAEVKSGQDTQKEWLLTWNTTSPVAHGDFRLHPSIDPKTGKTTFRLVRCIALAYNYVKYEPFHTQYHEAPEMRVPAHRSMIIPAGLKSVEGAESPKKAAPSYDSDFYGGGYSASRQNQSRGGSSDTRFVSVKDCIVEGGIGFEKPIARVFPWKWLTPEDFTSDFDIESRVNKHPNLQPPEVFAENITKRMAEEKQERERTMSEVPASGNPLTENPLAGNPLSGNPLSSGPPSSWPLSVRPISMPVADDDDF